MGSDNISGNNTIVISGTTNLPITTATTGQVLVWNVSSNTWVPQVIFSGSIFAGSGGGGGQVITSAPIQLDLPIECDSPSKKPEGATCKRCEEFNEFAESNQEDNTFLCYRCRHNL
jgi:hypothetical protein